MKGWQIGILVGLGIGAGIGIGLLMSGGFHSPKLHGKSPGSYHNTETWDVTWSAEGLPTRIVVKRNAERDK